MDKHEVNRLLFCMKELDELKLFRDRLCYAKETILLKEKTCRFKIISKYCTFKDEHTLTDIQMTMLYAFLEERIKYLENHIENADPDAKEIAEAIYSGEVSKDALKL